MMKAMRPMTRASQFIVRVIVLTLFAATLIGCSTPKTVQMHSLTDPELMLPAPGESLVHVAVVRLKNGDADEPAPVPVPRDRLTLTERNLRSHVEFGARQAGFNLVSQSEADLILYCSSETLTGERQAYRRMPVHETTVGSVHTRRGWRTFHGTTTSEVVVPVTRHFAHRTITLSAHYTGPDRDWPKPDDETAIWMGHIVGDEADLEEFTPYAIAELLRSWGRTERRTVRIDSLQDDRGREGR